MELWVQQNHMGLVWNYQWGVEVVELVPLEVEAVVVELEECSVLMPSLIVQYWVVEVAALSSG